MEKALLFALLQPHAQLKKLQDEGKFTELLAMSEEIKTLPYGAVWDEYLSRQKVAGNDWFKTVQSYEKKILAERK